jgi:hypothetical protein
MHTALLHTCAVLRTQPPRFHPHHRQRSQAPPSFATAPHLSAITDNAKKAMALAMTATICMPRATKDHMLTYPQRTKKLSISSLRHLVLHSLHRDRSECNCACVWRAWHRLYKPEKKAGRQRPQRMERRTRGRSVTSGSLEYRRAHCLLNSRNAVANTALGTPPDTDATIVARRASAGLPAPAHHVVHAKRYINQGLATINQSQAPGYPATAASSRDKGPSLHHISQHHMPHKMQCNMLA